MNNDTQLKEHSEVAILPNPLLPVSAVSKKRFISFSGGVESTTMCILYGKGATAIWCDTGVEEVEMYQRIDDCEKALKEIHNGDFELIRIKPLVKIKGIYVDNLEDAAVAKRIFPSRQKRWCTGDFKIEPINKFLIQQGQCELFIGFNADETPGEQRTGAFEKCKNVTYKYPLYEDGYNRDDCIEILNYYGLNPNFPIYMKRGGCRWCFFQGKKEMKAKCIFNKVEFDKDKAFEIKINQLKERTIFYPLNPRGSYQSIEDEVNREIALWGLQAVKEMYKNVDPHKPCGAFCHR